MPSHTLRAPPSAREFLRQATHGEHVRLNHHPLLIGLTRPAFSIDSYRQVIAAYYHFYRETEAAIEAASERLAPAFAYAPRCKLSWLFLDLVALKADPNQPPFHLAVPLRLPELETRAALAGLLYTIEGSTLGGQVIAKHLSANLGLTANNGARFFCAYGGDTDTRWTEFVTHLETTLITSTEREQAAASASTIFSLLEYLLDDHLARLSP